MSIHLEIIPTIAGLKITEHSQNIHIRIYRKNGIWNAEEPCNGVISSLKIDNYGKFIIKNNNEDYSGVIDYSVPALAPVPPRAENASVNILGKTFEVHLKNPLDYELVILPSFKFLFKIPQFFPCRFSLTEEICFEDLITLILITFAIYHENDCEIV